MSQEYITDKKHLRMTIYPIVNHDIWKMFKIQQAAFWTAEEIDFSKDFDDFMKLSSDAQYFIKMILAFFAASDTIVNMNLDERFISEITLMEAKVAYTWQATMENIHSETYSLMIDNIVRDVDEKNKLLNAIENYPCIKKKADWAMKWISSDAPFKQRVIAFACVEGIFFSGSFAAIFWLKKQNVMPGLCDSNELISRDEGLHTDFAVMISKLCTTKVDEETIYNLFKEAVSIEQEFLCESLPCSLLGMNSELMKRYIEFVADRLLVQLGYEKQWNTENPFDFMESISIEGKTNFFESRPTQYQKSSILNTGRDNIYELDEDF